MRKRLAVLVTAAVVLLGLAPMTRASGSSSADDPWLCLANRQANVGACLYSPL